MKLELDAAKRVVIKRAQKPLRNIDIQKPLHNIDTDKVAADVRNYYSYLKDISKVFSRQQLQDLGLNARDIDAIYGMNSGSRSNYENEAEGEEVSGYNYKRGYNTEAFEDVLNLGDDLDKNINTNRNEDIEVESLKREIVDLWENILDNSDTQQKVETRNSYLNEYYKRKKELERQKRIDSLLNELEEYLERKK